MSKAPVNLYTLHEHWLLCPTHIFWKNQKQACDRPQCLRCCVHSGIPPQLWRHTGLIERSLSHVDALLSPSEYTAGQHRAAGLTVPIHVMPTFSSLDPHPMVKDATAERPSFLYVGRVTASKGIATLLEEFVRLHEYDLLVVGDGDLRPTLQRQYSDARHIRFLNARPQGQLVPLYQNATALVLPSLAPEVFPLAILEAFACGTPAIVHDAGGGREAIDHTGGGLVYASREDLHQALVTLATDPTLREAMGRRARAGYERYYSQERYLSHYLNLIETTRQTKTFSSTRLTLIPTGL